MALSLAYWSKTVLPQCAQQSSRSLGQQAPGGLEGCLSSLWSGLSQSQDLPEVTWSLHRMRWTWAGRFTSAWRPSREAGAMSTITATQAPSSFSTRERTHAILRSTHFSATKRRYQSKSELYATQSRTIVFLWSMNIFWLQRWVHCSRLRVWSTLWRNMHSLALSSLKNNDTILDIIYSCQINILFQQNG